MSKTAETREVVKARQWRPILTAPKDGTEIDLWIPANSAGTKHPANRSTDIIWWQGKWVMKGLDINLPWFKHATHWMPIPLPPKSSKPRPKAGKKRGAGK